MSPSFIFHIAVQARANHVPSGYQFSSIVFRNVNGAFEGASVKWLVWVEGLFVFFCCPFVSTFSLEKLPAGFLLAWIVYISECSIETGTQERGRWPFCVSCALFAVYRATWPSIRRSLVGWGVKCWRRDFFLGKESLAPDLVPTLERQISDWRKWVMMESMVNYVSLQSVIFQGFFSANTNQN